MRAASEKLNKVDLMVVELGHLLEALEASIDNVRDVAEDAVLVRDRLNKVDSLLTFASDRVAAILELTTGGTDATAAAG